MSLSPRPETFTTTISDSLIFGARLMSSAMACADSSAGIMPSVRASSVVASKASASEAGTYSYVLQDDAGQISTTHSISAALDYPSIGPYHPCHRGFCPSDKPARAPLSVDPPPPK